MCLIAWNWQPGGALPLLVLANRDELYARPALALHAWPCAQVVAGKDAQAGGTWLGLGRGRGVGSQIRFAAITNFRPDVIIHLAAQAGVRYSLEKPRAYLDSNTIGTFNLLEAARKVDVAHVMVASTSSVYGANTKVPFQETDICDTPLTVYAATKKATEALGHATAHVYGIPMTFFRFFTVYGPWGRPDMAPFLFAKGILDSTPLRIFNNGQMWRDFTYVTDLARAVRLLMDVPPVMGQPVAADSLSPAAPFRVVNIGQSQKVLLMDFIAAMEDALGRKAIRDYQPMQTGDVPMTWADTTLLRNLTGFVPQTEMRQGVAQFVEWYLSYRG
jgi:UDP-glucuronate 4-epimerase